MTTPVQVHPSSELLQRFNSGDVTGHEADALEAHLESCADCCQRLRELPCDPLFARVRAAFAAGESLPIAPVGDEIATREVLPVAAPPASSVRADPSLPVHVPGYEILDEIGRGGMGVVYRARDLRLKRIVALKMVLAGGQADGAQRRRFETEAQVVAALQHPNIVQVYERGQRDDLPYFALEYVDGGSLHNRLLDGLPTPVEAAWLVEQLARGMAAAHAKGMIHRDLKPHNVLLAAPEGNKSEQPELKACTPKVTDFGLAKRVEGDSGLTQTGAVLGTPSYMAPEQAEGKKEVGPPADVYALGAILYECLTGRPPFRGSTPLATLRQVIANEPVTVRQLQPNCPRDLEIICHKCLHKEPIRRYATATELADELARLQANLPILARPVGRLERSWRWCRRNPTLTSMIVAIAFMVAVVLAVAVAKSRHDAHRAELQRAENESHRHKAALLQVESLLHLEKQEYGEALAAARHGLALLADNATEEQLEKLLEHQLHWAERGQTAHELNTLANRVRFLYGAEKLSQETLEGLAKECREAWLKRDQFRRLDTVLGPRNEHDLRTDVLDVGSICVDVLVQVAPPDKANQAQREALELLREMEDEFGPNPLLYRQRQVLAEALGQTEVAKTAERRAAEVEPRTAWEHYSLGRFCFRSGNLEVAAREFEQATNMHPHDFWPHFYAGICAYRLGRREEAVHAFEIAVALAEQTPECWYNLGLANASVGRTSRALAAFERALKLKPDLAHAALAQGVLSYEAGHYSEAIELFQRALGSGADPATIHYNLALVHRAKQDRPAAMLSLKQALKHNPDHPQAREVLDRLTK